MFITKKNKKTKNEYVLTSNGLWVRNFGTKNSQPIDINNLISSVDYKLFVENETAIKIRKIADVEVEINTKRKCLILSDGYDFEKIRDILPNIPKDVTIIGVNRSLAKWKKNGELIKRKMDYFLVNNPYKECLMFMPTEHRYFPKCIISSKTNPTFAEKYEGSLYQYTSVFDESFSGDTKYSTQLDDYRNPICAAISLAYKFKANKVALLCCDDSFKEDRPGSVKVNELYMYPQHRTSHGLIEGCLYWLMHQEGSKVSVVDSSHGPEYKEIPYINANELIEFFDKEV